MSTEIESIAASGEGETTENRGTSAAAIIGWFSVGMAVATLGILVGTELLSRYQFKKRTPYDFYANAGERQANEFGVGI